MPDGIRMLSTSVDHLTGLYALAPLPSCLSCEQLNYARFFSPNPVFSHCAAPGWETRPSIGPGRCWLESVNGSIH